MIVAAVQTCSRETIKANIEPVLALIAEAAKLGATYIQTPEMTNILQPNRPLFFEEIQSEQDDLLLKAAVKAAKQHKIMLHLGSLAIKIGEKKAANRSFIISPDGEIVARYGKIHLFDVTLPDGTVLQESAAYEAGDKLSLYKNIGLSICYDLRFPHLYRSLAQKGAEILAIPSSFTVPTGKAHWHVLMRARAIETGSFVIASAQAGLHECGRETYGHSLIINPWGEVIAEMPSGEGVIVAEIDVKEAALARARIPALKDSFFS